MSYLFELIIATGFGAIFGSYATLFAYRLPIKQSCFGRYFGKKSRCPRCDAIIKTRDLIPLFNWLFTLGKCRNCKAKIPLTHLFVELSTTIMFVYCYHQFSFSQNFILYSLIATSCIILLVCDFNHKVFPQPMLIFLLTIVIINKILVDQEIFPMIYSGVLGVILATIFYKIFGSDNLKLFSSKDQLFDYIKFILIAAISLNYPEMLLYFLIIIIIFCLFLAFNIILKKNNYRYGYIFILIFIYLIFNPILS